MDYCSRLVFVRVAYGKVFNRYYFMETKTQGERMKKIYESPVVPLQVGDVITSKLGFMMQSPVTEEWFEFYKQKYLGDGKWQVIGNKTSINVKKLKKLKEVK